MYITRNEDVTSAQIIQNIDNLNHDIVYPNAFVKITKRQDRIILHCIYNKSEAYVTRLVKWYQHNNTDINIIIKNNDINIYRDKLIFFKNKINTYFNYSCEIIFNDTYSVFSPQVTLVNIFKSNISLRMCVNYPDGGFCNEIKGFPRYISITDNNFIHESEFIINKILNNSLHYFQPPNNSNNYLLTFICYSKYKFCNPDNNSTYRIHFEDINNLMGVLKRNKRIVPNNILKMVLDIYNENKKSIFESSGENSLRVIFVPTMRNRNIDCLIGNGISYGGSIDYTQSNTPCLHWSDIPSMLLLYPAMAYEDHNYCRNPEGNEDRPYCFISNETYEFCDISPCKNMWSNNRFSSTPLSFLVIIISFEIVILFALVTYRNNKIIKNHLRNCISGSNDSELNRNSLIWFEKGKVGKLHRQMYRNKTMDNDAVIKEEDENAKSSSILVSYVNFEIMKNPDIPRSAWSGIPFVYMKNLNKNLAEPFTDDIHIAQFKDEFLKFLSSKSTSANFGNKYLLVKCEDSKNIINIRHNLFKIPELISLVGIVMQNDYNDPIPYGLIYEEMTMCDAGEYLRIRMRNNCPCKLIELVNILKQVTNAMCYFHQNKIVHADIALRNVFIYNYDKCSQFPKIKFSDFAKLRGNNEADYLKIDLTEFTNEFEIPQKFLYLPIKYMAPELIQSIISFQNTNQIIVRVERSIIVETLSKIPGTLPGDIYGFGVLVWELFHNGKRPFEMYNFEDFIRTVIQRKHPKLIPQQDKGLIARLIDECTKEDPRSRPIIREIHDRSTSLSNSFNLIPK